MNQDAESETPYKSKSNCEISEVSDKGPGGTRLERKLDAYQ